MLSSVIGGIARPRLHGRRNMELLPQHDEPRRRDGAGRSSSDKEAAAGQARLFDKIRCLDGLRGIACLLVFNYHFFWPWTPQIMMGWGAIPPSSPEPYYGWYTLPLICLLHRGRAMVAIFFAISGYVLTRHILRAINERRIEAAYHSLASASLRRIFRLYIPPTISMFLVAALAQMGAFRSNYDVYKGPDSAYINGTLATAFWNQSCANGTVAVDGPIDVARHLGVHTTAYLNMTEKHEDEDDLLCLNLTSKRIGGATLYTIVELWEKTHKNKTANVTDTMTPSELANTAKRSVIPPVVRKPNCTSDLDIPIAYTWIQYGGAWEEHPFIHDNVTYALQNFTRAYAEWANPFNFGHYHPRYDPHTFTIPMELRGSMVVYLFLLSTAALKAKWRSILGASLSAYSLFIGRWDVATFLGGTMLSEMDIRGADPGGMSLGKGGGPRAVTPGPRSWRESTLTRWAAVILALYFLSYPDVGAEWTPGFKLLAYFVPKYYYPLSGWMFYQAMGAMTLLWCVLRSPLLRRLLEGRTAQYMGKISFSFYLMHGPVLHSLGFWLMPRLFDNFGRLSAFAIGWAVLMTTSLVLSSWWYHKVDSWSVTVGKRVEQFLKE